MTEELRKRLEEEYGCPITQISQEGIDHFLWLEDRKKESYIRGYKEAIEQAKKWMKINVPTICTEEGDYINLGYKMVSMTKYLADFEAEMNKLWEGEK